MKQVLNIRLDGEVFEIEGDAYRRLNVFLSRATQRYEANRANNESPEVIERRLVSIFQSKANAVITLNDVEQAIKQTGQEDAAAYTWQKNSGSDYHYQEPKRVLRSPHDKKLGGVCGGLGVYFDSDPVLFRVGFAIGLLFGVGSFLYLLLWVVVPMADERDPRYF